MSTVSSPPRRSRRRSNQTSQTSQNEPSSPPSGFASLGLSDVSLAAVERAGFEDPSPVQAAFIPIALSGADCTGQARTGTGKTAAFCLPILERIDPADRSVQALVLDPTRELSEQVAEECRRLSHFSELQVVTIVGGRPMGQQVDGLRRGAQIVVGTPGRVIDLMNRGLLNLGGVKIVVLDEADRMLDIGFRPDIEKILRRCPTDRQTLLLSATMPPSVERLAQRYMRDPQRVDLSQDEISSAEMIEQFYATVDEDRKLGLLVRLLLQERPQQALVFTRTKRGSEQLYQHFYGKLPDVAMMNGDLPQRKRDQVMKKFRNGEIRLLIATDVVGRGIDVSGISHIVNYDIPEYHDDYVHRIGRTGRLSSHERGRAITFVTRAQGSQLTSIEMRVNTLLEEYRVEGYEPARPGRQVQTVDESSERRRSFSMA